MPVFEIAVTGGVVLLVLMSTSAERDGNNRIVLDVTPIEFGVMSSDLQQRDRNLDGSAFPRKVLVPESENQQSER